MDKDSIEILEKKIDTLVEKLIFYKNEYEKLKKENDELKRNQDVVAERIEKLLSKIDSVTSENVT